jgi:hypothetical protein
MFLTPPIPPGEGEGEGDDVPPPLPLKLNSISELLPNDISATRVLSSAISKEETKSLANVLACIGA